MALTPFKIDQFGGLNLRDDPTEFGAAAAQDLLNVDLDSRGRLRTRDGYASFGTTTDAALMVLPTPSTVNSALVGAVSWDAASSGTIQVDIFDSSGSVASTPTATSMGTVVPTGSYTRLGTYTWIPTWSASVNGVLRGFSNGLVNLTPTEMPAFVGVLPTSSRLVQGNYHTSTTTPSGANGSRSTVFFSNPGLATTYSADNWVELRPGDGEHITGMATWRDLLLVFKQSTCFVFYGESTDATGGAVFNFRPISLPTPLSRALGQTRPYVVAGDDGVYYSTNAGIYKTDGGDPTLISDVIRGLFTVSSGVSSSIRFDGNPPILSWTNDRLLATYTTAAGTTRTLVHDPVEGNWLLMSNLGTTGTFATFPPLDYDATPGTGDFQERMIFPSGTSLFYTDPNTTTDNGSGISWSYTSGAYDLDLPGQEKILRYSSMHGSGTVTLQIAPDLGSVDTGSAVALGTAPAVDEGFQDVDRAGMLFSHKLSGTGAARVSRVTHYLSHVRSMGLRSA